MIPIRSTEPVYSQSTVVISLIAANLLIFFYEISMDPSQLNVFIARHGIVPDRFHLTPILTSMFLHGGWLHVLGNMWFLWIYGRNLEDILGSAKFLAFYLICGVAAALVHIFFNPFSRVPTVGASGAIAGVMGAYLIKFPRARIITLVPVFVFLTTFEIPAALLLVYWFAIQFFSGFGSIGYSQISQGGIAWFAHVGGFVAGMLLVNVLGPKQRYRRGWDSYR
jgi:membrane associated rhomboid family serine protease